MTATKDTEGSTPLPPKESDKKEEEIKVLSSENGDDKESGVKTEGQKEESGKKEEEKDWGKEDGNADERKSQGPAKKSKRSAEVQIAKEDPSDGEDEGAGEEPKGPFSRASADVLKGRRILRANKSRWTGGGGSDGALPTAATVAAGKIVGNFAEAGEFSKGAGEEGADGKEETKDDESEKKEESEATKAGSIASNPFTGVSFASTSDGGAPAVPAAPALFGGSSAKVSTFGSAASSGGFGSGFASSKGFGVATVSSSSGAAPTGFGSAAGFGGGVGSSASVGFSGAAGASSSGSAGFRSGAPSASNTGDAAGAEGGAVDASSSSSSPGDGSAFGARGSTANQGTPLMDWGIAEGNGEEHEECVYEVRSKLFEWAAVKETEDPELTDMGGDVPSVPSTSGRMELGKKEDGEDGGKGGSTDEEKGNGDKTDESKEKKKEWKEMGLGPVRVLRWRKKGDYFARVVQRMEHTPHGKGHRLILNVPIIALSRADRERGSRSVRLTTPLKEEGAMVGQFSFKVKTPAEAEELEKKLNEMISGAES